MKLNKSQLLEIIQEAVKANGGNNNAQRSVIENVKSKLNEDYWNSKRAIPTPHGNIVKATKLVQELKEEIKRVDILIEEYLKNLYDHEGMIFGMAIPTSANTIKRLSLEIRELLKPNYE